MPENNKLQKSLALSRSASFRRFQGKIGSATYRLNTIFVGLEHISAGSGKLSGGIAVTWKAPESIKVAKQVADQARLFACLAATALAVDVIDQYLHEISDESWICLSETTKQIATKAVTRSADEGGAYGLHERALAIANELDVVEPLHVALLELLAKWRNSVVHGSIRDVKLSNKSQNSLEDTNSIYDSYSHLDIKLALNNFASKKTPVPKEVTSLIASAQNYLSKLDEAAIRKSFPNEDAVEAYCLRILQNSFINKSGVLKGKLNEYFAHSSDWRNEFLLKTVAPQGVTLTGRPVSPTIKYEFFANLARLNSKDLLKALGD